jgi:formylglycine-generating enzyme required for sulfatase activity
MKRHALLVALLCLSALFITVGSLNALTIPASEDSYTAPRNTLSYSTNNANSLVVDATRKSYLYFDLSDIPADAVVRWAKLRLFLPTVRTAGAGLSVHLVTGTWNESTRLADVPSVVTGSLGMIAPDKMASRRFVTVDVKDTVQKWINGGTLNEGFAIQPIIKPGSPTASVMLTSKEGPVFGLPAELDIEFQPEGGVDKPVTVAQLPSEIRALLTPPPIGFDQLSQSFKTLLSPTVTVQPVIPPSLWGSLAVQAQGVGNLSYQWLRNGVAITGETSSQLPLRGGLQGGTYSVVVSNGFANVTSEGIRITPPKFTDSFALVSGGTLPASSGLGALPVSTFYIGKTEVTWGEWQTVREWAVANGYPDLANVGAGVGDNYPVSHVSWYDVVKWCNARSEKEQKVPIYKSGTDVYRTGNVDPQVVSSANGYRLPSQKEWEFAAIGGTQTNGYAYSGSNDLNSVGWYVGNSGGTTNEVAKRLASELGIYDMSGNLSEWIGDGYAAEPRAYRSRRGGHWNDTSESCVIPHIAGNYPDEGGDGNGFRVATSGEYALGITAQPSVSSDGTMLSVEAAGAGTLTYQWKLNGGAIAGGTSSQLSTQGLQSGTYTVVVSNGFASKASGSIEVNVPKFFEIGRSGQPTASQDGRYYAIGNEDKIDIFENNGIKFHTVPMPGGRPYGNYELIGLSNNTGKLYLRTWNGYIIEGAGGVLELDVQTGSTKRVDVDSLGRIFTYQGWGVDRDAIDFSGNEQYVVMAIRDTEDSISWGTQEVNIYLKDLNSGRIQQIDPDEIGGYSSSPRVNSDGTKIVFISTKRLAPEATGDSNLYLWEDGVISLVNKSEAGTTFASAYGWAAGISGDGSKVVFQTGEALVPTDTNGVSDIYVKDIKQNKITRVSENNYGGIYPLISNDGTKIGFQTYTAPPVNESRIRLYSSSSQKTCEIPGVEATNKYQAVFHSESFVQLEDNTALIFTWKDYSRTDNNNDGDYYFIKGLNFLQPIQRETKSFYSLTDGRNGTPVESLSFVEPELGDEGQRAIWFSRSGNLDKLDQMKITFLPRTAHRGTDYTEHQNYSGYNIVHLGLGQSSDGIAFYIHRDDLNESDEDFIFKIEPQDSSDSSAVGFEAVIRIINRN